MEGRTKNTMKNVATMLAMQAVSVLASFLSRTFFVKLLATEYLGLTGLFTNIIAVLSLSELGFGGVIIIHLYKPLAEGDQDQICRLMNFYRKAYNVVGLFIIACGLVLTPFLDGLVKSDTAIPHLEIYFLLSVLRSGTSYFFVYKQSLLMASQQEYICSAVGQAFNILTHLLQLLFLWLTRQYLAYLLVSIVTAVGGNIALSAIADKKFPYLKAGKKLQLDTSQTRVMFKSVSSMMVHKVGYTIINSTDNILISSMLGVIYTGLYSNYLLIMNVITQITTIGLNAVSASVGDFNVRKSAAERKELFDALHLMSVWMFGMSAICFCCLFQPTIQLWLGEKYLLDYSIVLIISINFFANGLTRVPGTFSDVNGLFVKTKFKPVAMAAINLVTSVMFLRMWGLVGVFVGTLVSYVLVGLWVDPYFLYRDVFRIPPGQYVRELAGFVVTMVVIGLITYGVVASIPFYIVKVLACGLLSNGLLLLCYGRTRAFKFIAERLKKFLCDKAHK